jgi:KRAB domain-containing zinc finger protein
LNIPKANIESDEPQLCPDCGKSVDPKKFYFHYYYMHHKKRLKGQEEEDGQPAKCPQCDRTFKLKWHLRHHLAKTHKVDVPVSGQKQVCDQCGYSVTNKLKFFGHVFEKHGIELPGLVKFPCGYCERVFYQKLKWKEHEAWHNKTPLYFCDQCDFSTFYSSNMMPHKRVHSLFT